MFTTGQTLAFTSAKGTAYMEPPVTVTYVRPYEYGFNEHVVSIPGWGETAVLGRDLSDTEDIRWAEHDDCRLCAAGEGMAHYPEPENVA